MDYIWEPTGTEAALMAAISAIAETRPSAIQVLGVLGNGWSAETIDPVIASAQAPVFGGLFPGLIVDGALVERGAILIAHRGSVHIDVVTLRDGPPVFEQRPDRPPASAMIMWFDATCDAGPVLDMLFDELGATPPWIGGGAGGLDFVARPVIFTPRGLLAGVAVVAALSDSLHVGVAHGWQPIGTSLRVTESRGNDVLGLDWRPAFEVYRETVESRSGRRFADETFFDLASRYPLMLERIDSEGFVRDPLEALTCGGLRCAGDIPAHATVRIATGDFGNMLEAATTARARATADGIEAGAIALIIDCISRALVLKDRLGEEFARLVVEGLPQLGALTIGEIASCNRRYLQLHNKTVVIGIIAP